MLMTPALFSHLYTFSNYANLRWQNLASDTL